MLVNATAIKAIFINLKTIFNNAFDAAPSQWQEIAMLVPSSSKQNDYAWLSTFPRMRKWFGDKAVKALAASNYSIVNDDWEATVEVDRNDIDDDQLGIYKPQAEMAGFSAKQLPDEIVFELANQAFVAPCYDGQPFISGNHVVNGQIVSNLGAQKLSAATLQAARDSYGAARTAMRTLKDEEGRPLNVSPNVLLVPPALEDEARLLMSTERLQDGMPNPFRNTARVVAVPWLASDTAWYLLDTSKPVKPFIYQERKKPVFVQQTDPQTDEVFNRKKFKFGAEARAAGGYGFWQLAYGSTGTVGVEGDGKIRVVIDSQPPVKVDDSTPVKTEVTNPLEGTLAMAGTVDTTTGVLDATGTVELGAAADEASAPAKAAEQGGAAEPVNAAARKSTSRSKG